MYKVMQQVKKVRIGKDIRIRWRITVNGAPAELEKMDLRLEVVDRFSRKYPLRCITEGSEVVATWEGKTQQHTGNHTATLWVNWGRDGQAVVDRCNFVELVPLSCMEAAGDASIADIVFTDNITIGVQGKSAFESWLSQGYEGTEADFIAWIQKPALDAAAKAEEICHDVESLANEISAHPPMIGENGNWLVWDIVSDMYIDTGKPSTGDVLFPTFHIDPETMELVMDCQDGAADGVVALEDGELIFNA